MKKPNPHKYLSLCTHAELIEIEQILRHPELVNKKIKLPKKLLLYKQMPSEKILDQLSEHFQVPKHAIRSNSRQGLLCDIRRIYYAIGIHDQIKITHMAEAVNRHWSTVIHNLRHHIDYMEFDPNYREVFEDFCLHTDRDWEDVQDLINQWLDQANQKNQKPQ